MKVPIDKFCVYSHAIDGRVFYVGMGRITRPWQVEDRNSAWQEIMSKVDSYEVEILSWHDTIKEARTAELTEIRRRKPAANLNGFTGANGKVRMRLYGVRLKPQTVEGLRDIASGERRSWSTFLRNSVEDHVEAHQEPQIGDVNG